MAKKRTFAVSLLLLSLAFLFSACGGSAKPADASTAAVYEEGEIAVDAAPNAPADATGAGAAPTLSPPQDDRKIAITAFVQMESLSFDNACQDIQTAVQASGGYFSATNVYNGEAAGQRSASFTARVPADTYMDFIANLGKAGNVTSRSEQSEDVTDQYVDVEARLKSLRAQEERLLVMMGEAGKLADIILIQEQLTEVQYEIESYVAHQRALDNRTTYSTVHIDLMEVRQITEPVKDTYTDRIAAAFRDSWRTAGQVLQELGLAVVYLTPLLLVAAVVLVFVLVLLRRSKKKRAQYLAGMQNPQGPAAPPATQGSTPGFPATSTGSPAAPPPQDSTTSDKGMD